MSNVGNVETKLRIFEFKTTDPNGQEVACVVIADVTYIEGEPCASEIKALMFSQNSLVDFAGHVAHLEWKIYSYMEDEKYRIGQGYPAELPLPA